jgi:hypothetical protein
MSSRRRSLSLHLSTVFLTLAAGAGVQAQSPGGSAETASRVKPVYKVLPPPADFSPPLLYIAEPVYHWGAILQGETVQHSFIIENKGGAPLRIEKVKASCGCTTVDFDKVLAPGAKGSITLSIDSKKLGAGQQRKTADVETSDSRTPAKLTLEGRIDLAVATEPLNPKIDVVRGSEPEPTTVTLRRASDQPIRLLGIKNENPLVSVTTEEVEPGTLYALKLTAHLQETTPKSNFVQLEAQLEVAGKPLDVPVRVSVMIKERIEAIPPWVYFTTKDSDILKEAGAAPPSKTVDIQSLSPTHSFRITGVEVKGMPVAGRPEAASDGSTYFQTRIETVKEGSHYRLVVLLPSLPDSGTRRLSEKISVFTDDVQIPRLEINASAAISGPGQPAARPGIATPATPGSIIRGPAGAPAAGGVQELRIPQPAPGATQPAPAPPAGN